MRSPRTIAVMSAIALLVGACDHAGDEPTDVPATTDADDPTRPSVDARDSTSSTLANRPPGVTEQVVVRSGPGRSAGVELPIEDPDGDEVEVRLGSPVDGLTLNGDPDGWHLDWSPAVTGTTIVRLAVVDERGAEGEFEVTLRSTSPYSDDTLLALGDSVASGHGLDELDYLLGDDCRRHDDAAYPALVHAGLVARGDFRTSDGFHLVACSGATLADLFDDSVTGGPADIAASAGTAMTQVDWAVATNAEIVTITAGANTLGFTDPWNLLDDGALDEIELARRLARVADDLDALLERLVDRTDSRVFVTNYYNPAAAEPQGVEGCETDCFRQISVDVVGAFNDELAAVVAGHPADRVVLVDVASPFDGHGAPNGLGPDSLRASAPDWLREIVGGSLEGVHPYCARGHDGTGDSWINSIDCVHPDARGHREIAEAVLEAITR